MDGKTKIVIALFVLLGLILASNHFINKALKADSQKAALGSLSPAGKTVPAVVMPKVEDLPAAQPVYSGEIVRKNWVIPGNGYEESVFYAGDREIASQKIVGGVVVEQTGTIPNGRIKVIDEYQHTRGEEYYQDGKRTGTTRIYYENGKVKKEETYKDGKLLISKEYYNNGALHIHQDYQDALDIPGDTEVGVGKIYYLEGKLRYEWNLTRSRHKGFKRAYNPDGELIAEAFFDSNGKKIP